MPPLQKLLDRKRKIETLLPYFDEIIAIPGTDTKYYTAEKLKAELLLDSTNREIEQLTEIENDRRR